MYISTSNQNQRYDHMIFANHIPPTPMANFVLSPGLHEPNPNEGSGAEPPSASRSTHRAGRLGLDGKKLPSLSLGCSSDAVTICRDVDEEGCCKPFRLVVGNVFFAPPHIHVVICPVACATLCDKYTNMILVITKFAGRHLVPGMTSKTPFVSPASQK